MRFRCLILGLLHAAALPAIAADPPRADVLFADFESPKYGEWVATGAAFGAGPAEGTLPGQMHVSGYAGKRLVNSFNGGDKTTGTLTSPEFRIGRKYVSFLIGGGGAAGKTCVNLLVDGKSVRTATGPNTKPGGTEALEPGSWDVAELEGKSARIQVVDEATGGWGHVNVDHVVFTDVKPAFTTLVANASRELTPERKLLLFPVKNGARARRVKVIAGAEAVREFTIEAADGPPDWHARLDVSAWRGKALKVEVDQLPESSTFLSGIEQSDLVKTSEPLYREARRPRFHFSAARGWLNDPNGLAYFGGEYHLFFQHNPYGTKWGNMHWGHAVSKDLVRWKELDVALYPDRHGTMFSGSAVVDWNNTSGLGAPAGGPGGGGGYAGPVKPPLVLLYTADTTSVQGLAHSVDGRTFTKLAEPVVPKITGGNRDPKVIWHEPTKRWVMALYVALPAPADAADKTKKHRDTIHFLTSPNLKDWTVTSRVEGFYECPDFFPLAVPGGANGSKWVLLGANSEYMLGSFDGKTFVPETPKLKGHRGKGFYAAQTFSDIPRSDGRRIMIGWLQAPSPGMPFDQAMSVPLELGLATTAEGPRLTFAPVKELEALRGAAAKVKPAELTPESPNPFAGVAGESLEVRAELEFAARDAGEVEFDVRGVVVRYDGKKQELSIGDHRAAAPLRDNRLRLTILADRTAFEVFASDGVTYLPMPVLPDAGNRSLSVRCTRGRVGVLAAEAYVLESIWEE